MITVENNIIRKELEYYALISELKEYKRRKKLWNCPNLGLLTVAAYLPDSWNIEYIDLNYDNLNEKVYDLVFISATTAQAYRAYNVADTYRRKGIRVVMGGIHISVCPEEALSHADIIFVGEVENAINDFINDLMSNSLKRIYFSKKRPDLTYARIPRYDLAMKYPYDVIPIQISRGCPHQCEFCASTSIYGKKRRQKRLEMVEKEIKTMLSIWRNPLVFFTDDNMFIDKMFTWKLIEILKKYHLQWYSFSDIAIATDYGLVAALYEVGCRQLLIGFESLSQESLAEINKSQFKMKHRKYYFEAVEKIQTKGIGVVGSFVLGLDGDTKDTFYEIADFVEHSFMYATNLTILTPFPGTAIYDKFKRENRIFEIDWRCYNGFELTYYPKNMTISEFKYYYEELNIRVNSTLRMNSMMRHFVDIYKNKK